METKPKKTRKRIYGSFKCDYPGCLKVFIRADRLSRHKRNHEPSKRIPCSWPDCEQTFARNDVKERHYRRHLIKDCSPKEIEINDISASQLISKKDIDYEHNNVLQIYTFEANNKNSMSTIVDGNKEVGGTLDKALPMSNLIDLLFNENQINENSFGIENYEFDNMVNDLSPISTLKNIFSVFPTFPPSTNRKELNDDTRMKLISLIPSLNFNNDFYIPHIERFLEIYWSVYHPQYPILHRASFSNNEASPLLLLAMIMLGASLACCTNTNEILFSNPQALADEIAEPLRWLILSSPEFKPPAKVFIIQSLLLLETYEINSTSRDLHERSFLYHSTNIQLMRRSPILGGDPSRNTHDESSPHIWNRWIESESMKRACFMAFYLDAVNAIVYGQTLILYAHQLKLSLPCDEDLWGSNNGNIGSDKLNTLKTPKFVDTLKRVLHRDIVYTSPFGQKILLAGILTILYQMKQNEVQLSFLEMNSIKESWKKIISVAIDDWKTHMCPKSCCDTSAALYFHQNVKTVLPSMFQEDDTRCKFSLYHMAQIYMSISHYDCMIYAGAPNRKKVPLEGSDLELVKNKVEIWANSHSGRLSVVHSYLYLCEILLSPINDDIVYMYNPNSDPFFHQKNIIASALFVLFAYNFSLEGPESEYFKTYTMDYFPEKEDGYSYLKRVRKELSKGPGGKFHFQEANSAISFHEVMKQHADYLPKITEKNNMVGLLKIFYNGYKNSCWQIGREYAKLFRNCIHRCLGSKNIVCKDMYNV